MNLIEEFKDTANKLKKTQRIVFKKQDRKELSRDFNNLALKFDKNLSSDLVNYGGLCLLGFAKCMEGETESQTTALLKGARIFRKSQESRRKLGCIQHNSASLEGAHRCYSQALHSETDAVLKACIIREFKEINKNISLTSDFNSSPHRIFELEAASNSDIILNDYVSALEKLTDIIEDLSERKAEQLYMDVLTRIEITRLMLLIILQLPANRQSPSHVKLLERFSWENETTGSFIQDENLVLMFEALVVACRNRDIDSIKDLCDEISEHHLMTDEQKLLIEVIIEKYKKLK